MKNNIKKTSICIHALTIILLLLSCFFMYDFYKSLSGFIANEFRDPLVMMPMVFSYLVPVIAFIFYFYSCYVKKMSRGVSIFSISLSTILSIFNLVFIFVNIERFVSNNSLGVYDSLLSIFVKFPYDAICINLVILALQVLNLIALIKPTGKISAFKDSLLQNGIIKVSKKEYALLSILSILAFVFTGDGICAFNAIENTLYDPRLIYLILWVLLIPISNLVFLCVKFEERSISKIKKIVLLSSMIFANLLFSILFLIFELTTPGFIIHVGKPLFLIAFSVSLPIEMIGLVLIMVISIVVLTIRLIKLIKKSA